MKEHQIGDSEGSGSSTATRSAGFFRLGGSRPSSANRSHRFSTTGCREGLRRGRGDQPSGWEPWHHAAGWFLHQGGREMPEKAGGRLGQGLRDGWAAAALPPSPLPSQCNQGYPSPSLGWWQPSLQRHHCQLLRSSSFWRERSRGAREREGEPKGTCLTNSKGSSSPTPAPASPQRRLGPLAQAAGQALLLGAPCGGFRR